MPFKDVKAHMSNVKTGNSTLIENKLQAAAI